MQTCKTCGRVLEKRLTKHTAERLKKPYYYTAYYYCNYCKKLYHDEKFKVVNPGSTPMFVETQKGDSHTYDVKIWTDGACVSNGTPQARAAWAFVSDETERAGLVIGKQTNNVAEGLAIYHALLWAGESGLKTVKLHTDSQISLFNLQKDPSKVKQNSEIFYDIAEVIKKYGLQVAYEKVLGHSGDINNERADKLATQMAGGNR
jgi:ribonuclease HI